jgi:alpha-galactosidase
LSIGDRLRGRDLYPEFLDKLRRMPPDFQLMSQRMAELFGVFCMTGDRHAGEYIGFAAETQALTGYDFDAYAARAAAAVAEMDSVISGAITPAYRAVRTSGERVVPIIAALANDVAHDELAVNLPNDCGLIPDLPADAVVEVPGRVDPTGVSGVAVPAGALPSGLASLMRREVDIQRLSVKAAVDGDRNAALQALMLDSHIHSYAQATHVLDDLLMAQRAHLPRFA